MTLTIFAVASLLAIGLPRQPLVASGFALLVGLRAR
jgi:hypothetical protein